MCDAVHGPEYERDVLNARWRRPARGSHTEGIVIETGWGDDGKRR